MNSNHVKSPHIILLGASLDTGNLGVNALLVSTVKCILSSCPNARISLFEGRNKPFANIVYFADGQKMHLGCIGIRRNKTIWRKNHILRLLFTVILCRMISVSTWRQQWLRRNPYLCQIMDAHFVGDITGGDSFSDIYGLYRILIGSMFKMLIILLNKKFILLPQTYGPFSSKVSRFLARWSIRSACAVYSRDQDGLREIQHLLGDRKVKVIPQLCPDVAFVMDAIKPSQMTVLPEPITNKDRQILVGLNISGLLYHGGYTQNNMFGLKCDYKNLVINIIHHLLQQSNTMMILIPHVFPEKRLAVESDSYACKAVYEQLCSAYPDRLFCLEGKYDHGEIKYIIGRCNYFIGSRMHACIAALSQCIPAVGMAYSKKFLGVFDTVGVGNYVIDMREMAEDEILHQMRVLYEAKENTRECLKKVIPVIQTKVISLLDDYFVTKNTESR